MLTKQFSRYSLVGVLNTAAHWLVFALVVWLGYTQALANGLGFVVAASLSYWLNSHLTFQKVPHKKGYAFFMLGMGSLSVLIGWFADIWAWPGLVTLVLFSLVSLILGFAWSKWVVFRR